MRTMTKALAVTLLSLAATTPLRAQRAHFGGHAGYHFDQDMALVGAQILLPLGGGLELYPSFDKYFPDAGSLLGFNGDLKLRLPSAGPTHLYVGGGVNVLHASSGGASADDTGWDLFGGFETRGTAIHPYVEGRVLFHDRTTVQLAAGLNITLY
jgi:hypothetical protein